MLQNKYERFMEWFGRNPGDTPEVMSYRLICRRLHVAPADLDEILEEELGVSGEELLRLPATFVKFADYPSRKIR